MSFSLQLSHEFKICRKSVGSHGQSNCCKMFATTSLYLSSVSLSSHSMSMKGKQDHWNISVDFIASMHQDAWNVHLSAIINKPIGFVSSRHRVVACRSFILPGQGNEIPIVKAISVSLTRFCNALHGRPLLLQLVPAVGFISFAVWGLQPIMRFVRNLFLHKNDNGWKRSSAYHIMTSYLQPLLIWSGTILFYRVFDPLVLPTEASQVVKQRVLNFARSSSTVLAFAYCLSRLIQQAHNFFTEQNDSDDTRNMGFNFAGKALYTGVWVAAISLFMELLGFSTQKWVTAGGLGTVLLTLAGREIFTNFLSSVMIHATRPFVVNEWIQTKIEGYEVSGTVEHVGWWSPTIIRGDDREAVHIPNHKFTVNVVRNLSQKTHWRIKTNFAISHLDVSKINNIVADMRKVLAKSPLVEQQKLHRRVFLENINPDNQALVILVSCFVKTSHFEEYLCVKEAILLDLLRIINHHGARLATPIRTIQKIYANAGVDSVPYAETIFTHAGSTTTRPLLLIEPSLKVNTDRKTTDPPPSADEEQEPKPMRSDGTKVTSDLSPDSPPQTGSDVKHAKKTSSDSSKSKVDSPLASSTQHGNLDSSGLDPKGTTSLESEESLVPITENGSGGTGVALKPDTDSSQVSSLPVTRAPLEENLVLGVALDGSKRVLPIEEDMNPNTVDAKKLAASRNAGGVAPSAKDHKDGQVPLTVDQER